jgi:hypothetical protein
VRLASTYQPELRRAVDAHWGTPQRGGSIAELAALVVSPTEYVACGGQAAGVLTPSHDLREGEIARHRDWPLSVFEGTIAKLAALIVPPTEGPGVVAQQA